MGGGKNPRRILFSRVQMAFGRCRSKRKRSGIQPSSDGDEGGKSTISSDIGSEETAHNINNQFYCCGNFLRRRHSPGDVAKVRTKPKAKRTRIVDVNDATACHSNGRHFVSNHISTAKYTALTFFPKALFEQASLTYIPATRSRIVRERGKRSEEGGERRGLDWHPMSSSSSPRPLPLSFQEIRVSMSCVPNIFNMH